jgi:hypothetical protein
MLLNPAGRIPAEWILPRSHLAFQVGSGPPAKPLAPASIAAGRGTGEPAMIRPCEFTTYSLEFDGAAITADETEFLLAMLAYQKRFCRRYPSWREVLHVAHCLGYRKVAPPRPVDQPQTPLGEGGSAEPPTARENPDAA